MPQVKVELTVPREIYLTLLSANFSRKKMNQKARESFAMQLYKEGTLSIGKAAELCALPLADFMGMLVKNNIPVVDYTEDDYEDDKKALMGLRKKQ